VVTRGFLSWTIHRFGRRLPRRAAKSVVGSLLLALATLGLAGCTHASTPDLQHIPESRLTSLLSQSLTRRIDETAKQWIASGKSPGVAVEISQHGRSVLARGYGWKVLGESAPVRPDTEFRIGSVTKQFTAAAILQLVQQGRLGLDDRLSKFFPTFPGGDRVTVRELLTHTSGIHNYTEFGWKFWILIELDHHHTTAEWVRHIADQHPLYDFPPGTAWHYTNSGFYLLGAIVEKLSGMSLRDYFARNLFDPLGLTRTALDTDGTTGPDRAMRYVRGAKAGSFKPVPWYEDFSMSNAGGAGAVRSTADDLTTWTNALFSGRVVDPRLFETMITPARLLDGKLASTHRVNVPSSEPGGNYGFGIRIGRLDGQPEIGHEGDIPGFNAAVDTYPQQGFTVVVLANTDPGAFDLEKVIAKLLLAHTAGLPVNQSASTRTGIPYRAEMRKPITLVQGG
jgi:D-alanyl-D-alanine carboxypeptidase